MTGIRIYRYGLVVKDVFSEVELEAWIKDNVPPLNPERPRINGCYGLEYCLQVAKAKAYTFKRIKNLEA